MAWKPLLSGDTFDASWQNNFDLRSYDDFVRGPEIDQGNEDNRNIKSPIGDESMQATLDAYNFRKGPAIIPHHFTMSCECLTNEDFLLDTEKLRDPIKEKFDELKKDWTKISKSMGEDFLELDVNLNTDP